MTSKVCTWSRDAVGGPAGRQLDVADPRAVDERLVEAVGGRTEGGLAIAPSMLTRRRAGDGPLPGRQVVGLDGRDPGGVQVHGEQQCGS